ncbi:hypothetical protein EDD86DRAFT_249527 [Gorgonomyces haynaldii]|nr:hypothetical protein EDD86DRAFT_249527 [Gorgonomyces haynaldii]
MAKRRLEDNETTKRVNPFQKSRDKEPQKENRIINPFSLIELEEEDDQEQVIPRARKQTVFVKEQVRVDPFIDLSLKENLVLISDDPFPFLTRDSKIKSQSLLDFTTMSHSDDISVQFNKIFYHYELLFRNSPSQAGQLIKIFRKLQQQQTLSELELAEHMHYQKQREKWKIGFLSCYQLFKTGMMDSFVFYTKQFSILFYTLDGDKHATFYQASPGMMQLLRDEDIQFDVFEEKQVEKSDSESLEDSDPETPFEKSQNTLFISDALSLHALVDFFADWNDPKMDSRAEGHPILFSKVPFSFSCLVEQTLMDHGKVKKVQDGDILFKHRLTVSGILMPWQISDLIQMCQRHTKQVEISCKTLLSTAGLSKEEKRPNPWNRLLVQDGQVFLNY